MILVFALFLQFQRVLGGGCEHSIITSVELALKCGEQNQINAKQKLLHFERILLGQMLSRFEINEIQNYILGDSDLINRNLWRGNLTTEVRGKEAVLNLALNKIPSEQLLLHRGLKLDESIIRSYKKGAKIEWKGFTSLSLKFDLFFVNNIRFFVLTKNSKAVWPISPYPEELEYLLKSGTIVRILDHKLKYYKKQHKNIHEILVEEI